MIDSETLRSIREEIARQLNIILSGTAQGASDPNQMDKESIGDLYPGTPVIPDRPIMHPYGISSRAPLNTISVTARQGEHPGNRLTLGHRDSKRPVVQSGQVMLYDSGGDQIWLKNGSIVAKTPKFVAQADKIFLGSDGASEPLVFGNELQSTLSQMLTFLSTITSDLITIAGILGLVPMVASLTILLAQIEVLSSSPVGDGSLLSKKAFTE